MPLALGTAYYPEYHPESEWEDDLARIRDCGIGCVRFAEFAWSQIEPEPGRFDTGWMDRALDALARHGLTAVIGTPTAAPPLWLAEGHPEILPVDDTGRRTGHGMRQHRCYTAPAYRAASARVTGHLAQRYGRHPAVAAWQIDNEFGGEQKACHCDLCRAAWRRWLEPRYAGIADLNRRWGTAFWSQTYARFDHIPVPLRSAMQLGLKHNPSLMLEWMRFCSANIVGFCREQAAILRRHVAPGIPITTNNDAFGWGENVDLRELFAGLDVVGFDLYTQQEHEIAAYAELMHGLLGKPFWFLEYDVGSPKLAAELDLVAASGRCERLFFFKFRPFPWGQEQGTRSLLTLTRRPAPNWEVIRSWSSRPQPAGDPSPRRIAIYYDHDSSWAMTLAGWSGIPGDLVYPRHLIHTVYRAVHDLGRRARMAVRPQDLAGAAVVALPWMLVHDPAVEDAVLALARGGATVLLTQDCFLKNRDNVYRSELPRLYRDGLGVADFLDHAPADPRGLVHERRCGAGRLVVLARELDAAGWARWFGEADPA